MKVNGTSFIENAIYFYIHKVYPDALCRNKLKVCGKSYEVDVLIPSLKAVVEYDGGFWHEDKLDVDIEKTKNLNKEGYYVIRIRDKNLPDMDKFDGEVFKITEPNGWVKADREFVDTVNKTIHLLAERLESIHEKERILKIDIRSFPYNDDSRHIKSIMLNVPYEELENVEKSIRIEKERKRKEGYETAFSKTYGVKDLYEKNDRKSILRFFEQIHKNITYEDICNYAEKNDLYCDRRESSKEKYEVKIANDPEVAKLSRFNNKTGENVLFSYNSDNTLAYAEYSEGWLLSILYFGYGEGVTEPRKKEIFGWKNKMITNKWYYFGDHGATETDVVEEAINGAFKHATLIAKERIASVDEKIQRM